MFKRDERIAKVREWQLANPERVQAYRKRRNARPEVKKREREGYLRRKYNLTPADFEALLQSQGGVCAICRRPGADDRKLDIDHDHGDTERIRGILCRPCNHALGLMQDDPEVVDAAYAYLMASRRIADLR